MADWHAPVGVGKGRNNPQELARWRGELLRYVHRLTGDSDLAEDIAQEALLRLLKATPEVPANRRAWLFRVATNLVRDAVRHDGVRERSASLLSHGAAPSPDQDVERAERVEHVRGVLAQLKPRDRELLLLRESGFSHAEIAELLDVKPESVSTLRLRALDRFRKAFCGKEDAETSK